MKIDRLISIIMILLDKERMGAQELADMFEVSPRTIYRDIDAINMAGIPVRGTTGAGGGFEILQQYKIDKKVFSIADIVAILTGLSGVSSVINGEDFINALAKVKSFIPTDSVKEIELKSNQLSIDLTPWIYNTNIQPYIKNIKTALNDSRMLLFDYLDVHGNKTKRTVEPYRLVLKSNHWYFQGYCLKRKNFRLFRLSRIHDLEMLKDTFIPRVYPKPQLEFSDTVKSLQTKIKLRIHESILDRVLDYCAYENFLSDGKEYYIVDFPFIENDFYYDILLSFGDKCVCLEPNNIRKEILRKIRNIIALY